MGLEELLRSRVIRKMRLSTIVLFSRFMHVVLTIAVFRFELKYRKSHISRASRV